MKHLIVFIIFLELLGCNDKKAKKKQVLIGYQQPLNHLEARLDSLKRQEVISESYLASAQLNQVLRSAEEKERQLQNLNYYQVEIRMAISQVEDSIKIYSDSVSPYNLNR